MLHNTALQILVYMHCLIATISVKSLCEPADDEYVVEDNVVVVVVVNDSFLLVFVDVEPSLTDCIEVRTFGWVIIADVVVVVVVVVVTVVVVVVLVAVVVLDAGVQLSKHNSITATVL